MTTERNINDRILDTFGMMIVAPAVIIMASLAVLTLATPIIAAATVMVFSIAILMAGTLVTVRAPATALSALFTMSEGDATDRSACCDCHLAGNEVTFTVRGPEEESVDDKVGDFAEEML